MPHQTSCPPPSRTSPPLAGSAPKRWLPVLSPSPLASSPTSNPRLSVSPPNPTHQGLHEAGHIVHEQSLQLLQRQCLYIPFPGSILVVAVDDLEEGFLHWCVRHGGWAWAQDGATREMRGEATGDTGESGGREHSRAGQAEARPQKVGSSSRNLLPACVRAPLCPPHLTPCKLGSASLPCRKLPQIQDRAVSLP